MAFGAFLVAATLLALAPPEQARAQLLINIFPSRDDTNATLWVFSGSSRSSITIANAMPRIRSGNRYDRSDTHKTTSALFQAGTTTTSENGVLEALTPLSTVMSNDASATNDFRWVRFWATNANSITWGTTNTNDDVAIPTSATNTPTLTFTGVGSRTIANMYFRDVPNSNWDDIGPRISGSEFNFGTGQPNVAWYGAAIMTNKPISHFVIDSPGNYKGNRPGNAVLGTFTDYRQNQGLRIRVHAMVPEPKEYALVFALFALGFVFFHRHRQKKQQQRQQAQATTS